MIRRLPDPLPRALRIRLHAARGHYPAGSTFSANARLVSQDGLVFSAVQIESQESHGISVEYISEQNFLALEEVRFFAAISMSLPSNEGAFFLYPLCDGRDVSPETSEEAVLDIARELGSQQKLLTSNYQFHRDQVDSSLLTKLVEGIDLKDHLLMRGLGTLVSAQMLWQHREFSEPATAMLFIAMEVSFQLIRRQLAEKGINNASAKEAGNFLAEIFGETALDRPEGYFASFYEARIKTVHPESRYGIYPYPPLQADDYYFLRDALVEVFAFLCIGHKWPPYQQRYGNE